MSPRKEKITHPALKNVKLFFKKPKKAYICKKQKEMINLKQLLKDEHISKAQLSEILFPKNKFPGRSLLRILKGEAELSVSQVVALSEFTGLSLEQICEPDKWEGDLRDGSHIYIRSKDFRAEVDTKTWTTRIYYKDTLVKEEMVSPALPIAEYICTLEKTAQDAKELL